MIILGQMAALEHAEHAERGHQPPDGRTTVVFPVPGLPVNTAFRLSGLALCVHRAVVDVDIDLGLVRVRRTGGRSGRRPGPQSHRA